MDALQCVVSKELGFNVFVNLILIVLSLSLVPSSLHCRPKIRA